MAIKNIIKLKITVIILGNIEELVKIFVKTPKRYKTPKEIPVVFHDGSTYYYHFITKELAEELRTNLNVWRKTQKSI